MLYFEKKENQKFVYEPQLENEKDKIIFTSDRQLSKQELDDIFEISVKRTGKTIVDVPAKKVEIENNSILWEEKSTQ